MEAIDRDPTQSTAADRLAQLYRDKGDAKALVALLERRVKALAPLFGHNPVIRGELATMHEELGHLWGESLGQPKKATENFRRAAELDPSRARSRPPLRESRKPQGDGESDAHRRVTALREQAAAHRAARDLVGATQALAAARQIDERDPALQQEYGAVIVERLAAGESVPANERTMAAELLVALAEVYDGEHGLAYSAGALDIEPGHDRALQLYAHYARALRREDDVATRYLTYLQANPLGSMASDARWLLAASYEAAAQPANAIQILEPLRAMGDAQATAKLNDLYVQVGQQAASAPPASQSASRPSSDRQNGLLDAAQSLANQGMRAEAYQKYREALQSDPVHPEALSWTEDYLRTKRDYAALRDLLLAAVRAPGQSAEDRKQRLREVAALCESTLRDTDGATNAWKQLLTIDRADEGARQSLTRLLEKTQRWDDLAKLMEQEATVEGDIEKRISLEKKLATLHEQKRHDHVAAAEAWARIVELTPEDDRAVATASKLFEQARAVDRAAQVIADNLATIVDPLARGALLERLGRLREHLKDPAGAGEAYGAAAEVKKSDKLWEAAERCFVAGGVWDPAAHAAVERAHLTGSPKVQAQHFARAAEHFARAGDEAGVLASLERANDLDETSDEHAQNLSDRYTALAKWPELVRVLQTRGNRLTDKAKRIAVRRQAAKLYEAQLSDAEAARETWWKVLEDGDDKEALERLIDDSVAREDFEEATTLLRRLGKLAVDDVERSRIALREAELLAEGVGDVEAAIARYEGLLADIDPACRPALQAIADLQEARESPAAAVGALERELKLVADPADRVQIGWRLARLYEQLDDTKNAIRALELVREVDREDFDALGRLCDLCERSEEWGKTAELLAQRIEVEADEAETGALTRKLASVLADKLDRGDEALATLSELADIGHEEVRAAYVELGDRLGWRGIVATKLVEWWFEAEQSPRRITNLRGAFERFVEVGREQDAVRVACEIVRSKGADPALAENLERLSIKTRELDGLAVAHDVLVRDLTGIDRARELARQAEARVSAGAPRLEALQHGEAGLTGIAPQDAEEFLERLALIAEGPTDVVDLYERQITRCRLPGDRVSALARAAQVAASKGQIERASGFLDLALSGAPTEEMIATLELAARGGDEQTGGEQLRRALCIAMAAGGLGARDGGRTRGALIRRAASLVQRDLGDLEQAFIWLGDSLIAHVDTTTLDALEDLAFAVGDPSRAEATVTRALGEVFDGPLVRLLFARRARLRRERLGDMAGAAADLKKLHELSPGDQAVTDELSAMLTELGDHRGMVQLYEDLILRGKEPVTRAELARKVARMWEEHLADPREAADAWRRVLRIKAGDDEATAGLERAKTNMLRRSEPSGEVDISPSVEDAQAPPPGRQPDPGPVLQADVETLANDARPTPVPGAGEPTAQEDREPSRSERPPDAKPKKKKSKKRLAGDHEATSERGDSVPPGAGPEGTSGANEPLTLDLDITTNAVTGEVEIVDGAEMIDVEESAAEIEESDQTKLANGKRAGPPPLPRG
ncbi:MAG: hypothetical protein M3O46_13135 [Myxococcota bacterium]|nr:hypothetical protein [Myxococcota bacterium]